MNKSLKAESENLPVASDPLLEKPKAPVKKLKTLATTGWTSYLLVAIALLALLGLTVNLARWTVESKAKDLTKAFVLSTPENPEACNAVTDAGYLAFVNKQ